MNIALRPTFTKETEHLENLVLLASVLEGLNT